MNLTHTLPTPALFLKSILGLLLLLSTSSKIYSQELNASYKLGSLEDVVKPYTESHLKSAINEKINLQISSQKSFSISIQSNNSKAGNYYLFGKVDGFKLMLQLSSSTETAPSMIPTESPNLLGRYPQIVQN